ncbi:hypothetical protein VTJ04DRAFT_4834 [Mycothermus thermophilus]|uniref:uncharacterized protein n=1 Tax=Humicola insolens TaxID=85995 RepID=UPI003743964C
MEQSLSCNVLDCCVQLSERAVVTICSKLKDYCAELQREVENIWGQANQKISSLTNKIRDMEREEHALRRKCEELRLTLENRTRELSQSQELYSKLKQRVLFGQTQEVPPSLVRAQTPLPPAAPVDSDQRTSQQQPGRPVPPPTTRVATSNYFPASPGYSTTQPVASTNGSRNPRYPFQQLIVQKPKNFCLHIYTEDRNGNSRNCSRVESTPSTPGFQRPGGFHGPQARAHGVAAASERHGHRLHRAPIAENGRSSASASGITFPASWGNVRVS